MDIRKSYDIKNYKLANSMHKEQYHYYINIIN